VHLRLLTIGLILLGIVLVLSLPILRLTKSSIDSSVNETAARDTQTITSLAQSLGLTLKAFGEDVIPESYYTTSHCSSQSSSTSSSAKGHIELSLAFNHELEPAPRTPTSGKESKPWDFLSGTIKATYYSHRAQGIKVETTANEGDDVNSDVEEKKIIVSPGMSTGNTGEVSLLRFNDY